jgi:phosphoglucosamine mutase
VSRLFGTDGIRGVANEDLKPSLAHSLGRAIATRLAGQGGRILVGQDTRRSGDMLVAALMSGATSAGADVHALGICPTPALAHVTAVGDYAAGVMVSASHNPADDNGLKVLSGKGLKLDDEMEDELETLLLRSEELGAPRNDQLGRVVDSRVDLRHYLEHRLALARSIGSDLRLHVDCANGSASAVAGEILAASGASVQTHYDAPDGININLGCGATVPETLAAIVRQRGGDVGFSLDGDADRCVAVDERGEVVDGDQLLGIIALDRLARGALAQETMVVTILSNGGLVRAVEQAGGRVLRTRVGDRYIVDSMLVSDAGLGGEKSGHVIIREYTSTGDGIVTALEILGILARTGRRPAPRRARGRRC